MSVNCDCFGGRSRTSNGGDVVQDNVGGVGLARCQSEPRAVLRTQFRSYCDENQVELAVERDQHALVSR